MVLQLALTVKTNSSYFPAFSDSLQPHLTFKSCLPTSVWLDSCSVFGYLSELPGLPSIPSQLCLQPLSCCSPHPGMLPKHVGLYLPNMWESYTDTTLMPGRPTADSQSPGTAKTKRVASSQALVGFLGVHSTLLYLISSSPCLFKVLGLASNLCLLGNLD